MAREIISWIDADGIEHNLSGLENIDITLSPQGRFMPTFNMVEQDVPLQYGSRLRNIAVKSREIDLPIEISCISTQDLRTALRQLMSIFNPLKGDGQLKCVNEDGTQRFINCRYSSGLEIQESGLPFQRAIIVLKAFDPFWYDSSVVTGTYILGQQATFFPFFPLRLTNSNIFADFTMTNDGDVESWPEWVIQGPGDTIFLRNLTTGELINLNTSLGLGESITIETKPGMKTIKKNDGTNLYSSLSNDSALWSIKQGSNSMRIEMANATTDSSVQISYSNRYWSP